ncbi:MAG: hypothetical protein NT096_04475 [Proteobacteria bacterium]|nr:hypothetical protein [Pseudomonadota bacterium]
MIPNLLWRCPLCFTIDALHQQRRWFTEDLLRCVYCHAQWSVIRRKGDDYYLRLLSPEPALGEKELPLWAWYERMKESFTPQPRPDRPPVLKPDEHIFLQAKSASLVVQEDNPEFFPKVKKRKEIQKLVYPFMRKVGKGALLLTDQRLIWQKDKIFSFWFSDLDSVYIEATHYLGLASGARIYKFKLNDSYLKWLTHLAHLASQKAGNKIFFSNY